MGMPPVVVVSPTETTKIASLPSRLKYWCPDGPTSPPRSYVALIVMCRTLLRNVQIRFPQTLPPHNSEQRGPLRGEGWFTASGSQFEQGFAPERCSATPVKLQVYSIPPSYSNSCQGFLYVTSMNSLNVALWLRDRGIQLSHKPFQPPHHGLIGIR